jgi:hypothetical protein
MIGQTHAFTNGRLVNLDCADASFLEVNDFVTESESELLGLKFARDVGTGERPVEDGDGTGKHTLHRELGKALSVATPLDGHGTRAGNVRDDDGRSDISTSCSSVISLEENESSKYAPGTVTLNPGILGEDKALELFTEVLNHVITLGFTVNEEVETNLLLEANDSLNLLLDELLVLGLSDFALAKLGTGLTNLLGLLNHV